MGNVATDICISSNRVVLPATKLTLIWSQMFWYILGVGKILLWIWPILQQLNPMEISKMTTASDVRQILQKMSWRNT